MENNTFEVSVKTASGKEFRVDHCSTSTIGFTYMLYIEFIGYSMSDIFPVFSDENETQIIEGLLEGKVSKVFKGYTSLAEIFIVPNTDNNIRIRLEQNAEQEYFGIQDA